MAAMDITASLRVRAETQDARPSRLRMEVAAEILRASGFDILRLGRFAILVRAAQEVFMSEFKLKPEHNQPLVASVRPRSEGLVGLIDGIEVAPTAESLDRASA